MIPILQSRLPHLPWVDPKTARLPGIQPIEGDDWLRLDEAFAPQMAERDRLIASVPTLVHALPDAARPAALELFDLVLSKLASVQGYSIGSETALRPDGITVDLDRDAPLLTLGRLLQEDLCLMEKRESAEHTLSAAILCFPASWTLAEKLGRPMIGIHRTVPDYDANIAVRVQRLFDAIHPDRPLWRMNHNLASDADLFRPRAEDVPHGTGLAEAIYVRSERQCLVRLPQTGAVVFSIHTYLVAMTSLTPQDRASLLTAHGHG
jgi:hypothetical protein